LDNPAFYRVSVIKLGNDRVENNFPGEMRVKTVKTGENRVKMAIYRSRQGENSV